MIENNSFENSVGIPIRYLDRHGGVFGSCGSGKTWLLCSILIACHAAKIPVVFYSPIRGEQLLLKMLRRHKNSQIRSLARDLRIYTLGRQDISPFSFNPLKIRGGNVEELISATRDFLDATVASFPTLKASSQDALLLAILDSIGKDDLTMAELVLRIQDVLAAKEFQGELKGNLQATTENRLQHLITGLVGQIFDSQLEIPKMSDLLNGYSIFEFDGLSEQDIGLIIHAHLNLLRREIARISGDDKPIRLVIIVDEAHIIVPDNNGFHSSEDSVDTLEASTKVIIRALAELRKHGVSVILADQSPSRVSRDVVRLVGSLVAMKTTDREDREILGSSMNFSDFEFQDILNLKTGEAYLSTPGLIRPRKFRTSPPPAELHGRPPTDGQLIEMLKDDPSLERNRKKKLAETVRKFETGLNKLETDLSQEYGKIAKAKERVEKGINAGRLEASLVCETALQLRRCRSEISSLLTRFKKVFFFVLTERYSKDRNEKQLLKLERLRSRFRDDVDKVATHSMRLLSDLATRYDELIK